MIRPIHNNDIKHVCDIYNYYVINTTVTFEEEVVTVEDMQERVNEVTAKYPWLVCELEGRVVGYAYAGPWKSRCAYRYSVESSVYLSHDAVGKGIGTRLYQSLLDVLKNTDVHGVIGGVAMPNEASVALHEKFGFQKVAHFKEVGYKFNQWIDVAYWEKIMDADS